MEASRQRAPRRPGSTTPVARSRRQRRPWRIIAPIAVIIALAAGWCGLWYYSASVADRTLSGWVAREAAAGRVYTCGSEGISGFPLRIQAHCTQASAKVNSFQPPFAAAAQDITFTAPVYQPTVLTGDITGPLTVAVQGQPPSFVATWSLARINVSGLPPDPDAVSFTIEQPHLDHGSGAGATTLFAADAADFTARIIAGSAASQPVIDAVFHLVSAKAPSVQPLLADPLKGDMEVVLRGFKDLAPKPLAARLREMQATGGSIEIKSLRIERADAIVTGSGTLTVNADGKLDGLVHVAVSGLENIVPQLGIDKLIGQGIAKLTGTHGQPGQGLSVLDNFLPGLSGVVRDSANASVVDDLKKMGQPTQIDNKAATALPLRISDGAVYLGMLRVGEIPPLF